MSWFSKLVIKGVEFLCKDSGAVRFDSIMSLNTHEQTTARNNIDCVGNSKYNPILKSDPQTQTQPVVYDSSGRLWTIALFPSENLPLPDGTASAGTPLSRNVSKWDHIHPLNTTLSQLISLINDTSNRGKFICVATDGNYPVAVSIPDGDEVYY